MSLITAVVDDHLERLAVHGYAPSTIRARRHYLSGLSLFLAEWGVTETEAVTPALLEAYQHHLYLHRTRTGEPLSFRTQAQRLIAVRALFSALASSGELAYNPAAGMRLPRTEHRLPEAVLSEAQVEAILSVPDTTTPLGVRDRAMLEVLWSTAIRSAELGALRVCDVDFSRASLFVRHGKGGRDRHVPIGTDARRWVARYRDQVRPVLSAGRELPTQFLSYKGTALSNDVLSRTVVGAYIRAGAPGTNGSCHLFRHTVATLMLDRGADVRYVAELLGHHKLETTMIYTRVSLAKLREVHGRFHPAEQKDHDSPRE
jgi:integrase/recombinase XerD